jgi:hypothetical protein
MSRFGLLYVFLDRSYEHSVVLLETDGARFYDKGFGEFASGVVGDGNDAAVCDGGVGEEMGF